MYLAYQSFADIVKQNIATFKDTINILKCLTI